MWSKLTTRFSTVIVIIAFSCAVLFSSSTANAQSFFKVNSNTPPSSGSTNTTSDNSSSGKTLIYVAMGAAVVGALLYKFVFHKDKEVDSTKTENSTLLLPQNPALQDTGAEISENQNSLPVNLFLAVKKDYIVPEQRTYIVGLSFNF